MRQEIYELNVCMWMWKAEGLINNYGINQWPHQSNAHIAHILGYENATDMLNNWKPRSSQLCAAMQGEHGLTVYKALLAKANYKEEQKHDYVP